MVVTKEILTYQTFGCPKKISHCLHKVAKGSRCWQQRAATKTSVQLPRCPPVVPVSPHFPLVFHADYLPFPSFPVFPCQCQYIFTRRRFPRIWNPSTPEHRLSRATSRQRWWGIYADLSTWHQRMQWDNGRILADLPERGLTKVDMWDSN